MTDPFANDDWSQPLLKPCPTMMSDSELMRAANGFKGHPRTPIETRRELALWREIGIRERRVV